MFAHLNPHNSDFGIFVHSIPLACTSSPCNLLFLNLGIYGLVQATVGIGTVLIWYFAVAYTKGGGGVGTLQNYSFCKTQKTNVWMA